MKTRKIQADCGRHAHSPVSAAELDALLVELASSAPEQSAPSALRQRLLAEVRLQTETTPLVRTHATLLSAALSAALLICAALAGTVLLEHSGRFSPLLDGLNSANRFLGMKQRPAQSDSSRLALPSESTRPDSPHSGSEGSYSPEATAALLLAAGDEGSTDATSSEFFVLPYSDPSIANGTQATVRISVPSSQLIAWGVPSTARGLDEEIPADLLLGDDGLPRAIRVLPTATTNSTSTAEEIYP